MTALWKNNLVFIVSCRVQKGRESRSRSGSRDQSYSRSPSRSASPKHRYALARKRVLWKALVVYLSCVGSAHSPGSRGRWPCTCAKRTEKRGEEHWDIFCTSACLLVIHNPPSDSVWGLVFLLNFLHLELGACSDNFVNCTGGVKAFSAVDGLWTPAFIASAVAPAKPSFRSRRSSFTCIVGSYS